MASLLPAEAFGFRAPWASSLQTSAELSQLESIRACLSDSTSKSSTSESYIRPPLQREAGTGQPMYKCSAGSANLGAWTMNLGSGPLAKPALELLQHICHYETERAARTARSGYANDNIALVCEEMKLWARELARMPIDGAAAKTTDAVVDIAMRDIMPPACLLANPADTNKVIRYAGVGDTLNEVTSRLRYLSLLDSRAVFTSRPSLDRHTMVGLIKKCIQILEDQVIPEVSRCMQNAGATKHFENMVQKADGILVAGIQSLARIFSALDAPTDLTLTAMRSPRDDVHIKFLETQSGKLLQRFVQSQAIQAAQSAVPELLRTSRDGADGGAIQSSSSDNLSLCGSAVTTESRLVVTGGKRLATQAKELQEPVDHLLVYFGTNEAQAGLFNMFLKPGCVAKFVEMHELLMDLARLKVVLGTAYLAAQGAGNMFMYGVVHHQVRNVITASKQLLPRIEECMRFLDKCAKTVSTDLSTETALLARLMPGSYASCWQTNYRKARSFIDTALDHCTSFRSAADVLDMEMQNVPPNVALNEAAATVCQFVLLSNELMKRMATRYELKDFQATSDNDLTRMQAQKMQQMLFGGSSGPSASSPHRKKPLPPSASRVVEKGHSVAYEINMSADSTGGEDDFETISEQDIIADAGAPKRFLQNSVDLVEMLVGFVGGRWPLYPVPQDKPGCPLKAAHVRTNRAQAGLVAKVMYDFSRSLLSVQSRLDLLEMIMLKRFSRREEKQFDHVKEALCALVSHHAGGHCKSWKSALLHCNFGEPLSDLWADRVSLNYAHAKPASKQSIWQRCAIQSHPIVSSLLGTSIIESSTIPVHVPATSIYAVRLNVTTTDNTRTCTTAEVSSTTANATNASTFGSTLQVDLGADVAVRRSLVISTCDAGGGKLVGMLEARQSHFLSKNVARLLGVYASTKTVVDTKLLQEELGAIMTTKTDIPLIDVASFTGAHVIVERKSNHTTVTTYGVSFGYSAVFFWSPEEAKLDIVHWSEGKTRGNKKCELFELTISPTLSTMLFTLTAGPAQALDQETVLRLLSQCQPNADAYVRALASAIVLNSTMTSGLDLGISCVNVMQI